MTESTRLFRAGALAGILLLPASAVLARAQQQAPPQSMPVPRYQSPGVSPMPAEPTRQYQLPQTPAITPNATVVEDIIVRVNDQIISRSDLERAHQQLQGELAQGNSVDADEREKNLLRDLIDQQLLLSKGKELSINPDAEVVRRLDEIRKQNNLPSMEALEAAARSQGYSFEDFKASIRNNIITGQVVRDEVGRTIHMNHTDEQKFYQDHKADFSQPEQVRLSEILVPTAANADETQLAAAQKSSQDIYDKLKGGADFAATAKAQSGGPTAAQGGDLGQFKHGALAPVLEQKTFALPVGGFTEPTRTRQGFVILKATEHQQAGTPPLDQIEAEVQNAMYQEQIQPALRAYLTRLREEAFLDTRPGFVDSGASSKQTKPVFAAYVAPVPKKKVEKKRMDATSGRLAQAKTTGAAAATTTATPAVAVLDKHGKPKKVKREKVRFGQAPRTALPESPESGDQQTAAGDAAPGRVISPIDTVNTVAANTPDENAETPTTPAAPHAKTRYASREPEVKAKKVATVKAKAEDRKKATPIAATDEEKQTKSVQAGALGANGDTATKKKVKRKKGDPKDRLQNKPVEQAAPLQDNGLPDRLHQMNAPTRPDGSKVTSDSTTLPPTTQPAPGSTIPSQTPPTNGGAASPTSNQPVPQTPQQPQ